MSVYILIWLDFTSLLYAIASRMKSVDTCAYAHFILLSSELTYMFLLPYLYLYPSASKTSISDVGFHAAPKEQEERGGKGGRGGRGAARNAPRAGRGASRGQAKVDINDSSAFPKL